MLGEPKELRGASGSLCWWCLRATGHRARSADGNPGTAFAVCHAIERARRPPDLRHPPQPPRTERPDGEPKRQSVARRRRVHALVRAMRTTVTVTVRAALLPWPVTGGTSDARTRSWTVRAMSTARCPSARTQRMSTCQPEPSWSPATRTPHSGESAWLSATPGTGPGAARARRLQRVGCRAFTPLTARAASAALRRISAGAQSVTTNPPAPRRSR